MWQRFTDRAKRVVFFAQEEAAHLGENYVSPSTCCLAWSVRGQRCRSGAGPPGSAAFAGAPVERRIVRGEGRTTQDMTLDPRARRSWIWRAMGPGSSTTTISARSTCFSASFAGAMGSLHRQKLGVDTPFRAPRSDRLPGATSPPADAPALENADPGRVRARPDAVGPRASWTR